MEFYKYVKVGSVCFEGYRKNRSVENYLKFKGVENIIYLCTDKNLRIRKNFQTVNTLEELERYCLPNRSNFYGVMVDIEFLKENNVGLIADENNGIILTIITNKIVIMLNININSLNNGIIQQLEKI